MYKLRPLKRGILYVKENKIFRNYTNRLRYISGGAFAARIARERYAHFFEMDAMGNLLVYHVYDTFQRILRA
jgi:hypothetical protein